MSSQKLLVTIDDKVYDLTTFRDYHPGGSGILEQYHEKDGSDIFRAFHGEAGFERLKNLKGVPVENPEPASESILAYRKLRQQLRDEGYFIPDPLKQLYKIVEVLSIMVAGVYATWVGHWFIGAVLVGIAYQQLGWLGHDACHHGLTSNRKLNNFLGYIFGNILNGFSVNWWKDRHNTHHAITNVNDADPDVDNLPLFVWSVIDIPKLYAPDCRGGKMAPNIVPHQHLYFVPFTVILKLIWCFQTINFLLYPEYHNKSFLKALFWERVTTALHYILLLGVLCMTPGIFSALTFFFVSEFIGGSGIALIVFMNHYACEQLKKEEGKEADFLTLQLTTTKNINPGIWMDWFAGGLNYQVEHHLFPTIPRHNLPKIKPMVEEFCSKYRLPYMSETWTECLTAVEIRLAQIAHSLKTKP